MDLCRICLVGDPEKDIFQLHIDKNVNKNCGDIIKFCLDIQVNEDSKIGTKLCLKCYKKLLLFHKFKSLAMKNDEYLKSLNETIIHKNEIFIKDDIKTETMSISEDDYDGSNLKDELNIDDMFVKAEGDIAQSNDSDDEMLSVIKKIKYEYSADDTKENAQIKKGRKRKKTSTTSNNNLTGEKMCEECGKTVKDLKAHSFLHLPESERKRIKCNVCDKTFASYGARYKHNKIKHLGIRKTCHVCNKVVTHLNQHLKLIHFKESLPYACVPCGRKFISKSSLDAHMTTHTKDRPHECDQCEKKFSTKALMMMHRRQVHEKEKSHLCQLCSKSFFKKHHLQIHLRSHTKEKPYECPDCGKYFSSSSVMKSHREIHNDVKSYACTLCEMTFIKKNYLRTHMISHTKEKRHPCQYCNARFGRSDHRKRHEFTAHQKHLVATNAPTLHEPTINIPTLHRETK